MATARLLQAVEQNGAFCSSEFAVSHCRLVKPYAFDLILSASL